MFIPHRARSPRKPRRERRSRDKEHFVPATGPIEPCAGGIVFDAQGRLLVIERGRPPAQGRWSVPGGRCRAGESTAEACVRELREETGLDVTVVQLAGQVERDRPGGGTYLIDDFVCRLSGGALCAGDDAADARWVTRAELARLPLSPGLWEALEGWDLLPA
jgi:8-oxo-dGTP diphosphatase